MRRTVLFLLIFVTRVFAENAYHEEISVDVVNVFALARDSKGKIVRDLRSDEITVLENGVSQSIVDISNFANDQTNKLSAEDLPLSVTFALDISASMLMEELKKEDKMMLASFSRYPKTLTEMTSDKQRVEDLLLLERPMNEKTAIYDSLSDVLDRMQNSQGTKILVLCTDGEDNSSRMNFTSFLNKIAGMDVLVLAFTIPSGASLQNQYEIKKIAEITGGYAFFPTSVEELKDILAQLKHTIRNQYSIWYRTSNNGKDGNWRDIQILCHRPGIELYHRPGYFAR